MTGLHVDVSDDFYCHKTQWRETLRVLDNWCGGSQVQKKGEGCEFRGLPGKGCWLIRPASSEIGGFGGELVDCRVEVGQGRGGFGKNSWLPL